MKWRWLTIAWGLMISGIVILADRKGPSALAWVYYIPAGDKLGHLVLMGGMAFGLNQCLGHRHFPMLGRNWLLGSAWVWSAATLEECSQLFFTTRSFDLLDLAADGLGIFLAGRISLRMAEVNRRTSHAGSQERI